MKKVILSLAAAAALTAAVPAAAQPYGQPYGQRDYNQRGYDQRGWTPVEVRLERLRQRIQRGVQSGRLTRREAQGLRLEFRDLAQRERVYSRNGLSWQERADLDARFDRLSARIRWERRDGEDRGEGYGRPDRTYERPHRGY